MTTEQIIEKFERLSAKKKVDVLYTALEHMQHFNGRSVNICICIAMGYAISFSDDGLLTWEKRKIQ